MDPLIDVRFFASVPFSGATVIAIAAFVALGGFLFLNTLYLQDGRGLSPLPRRPLHAADGGDDGRRRAVDRTPRRRAAARAPSLVIGGVAILISGADAHEPDRDHLARLADRQLRRLRDRLRLGQPADHEHRGLGDAAGAGGRRLGRRLHSRQVGQSLGVALAGAIAVVATTDPAVLATGTHPGWWLVAGCGLLIVVLGLVTTTRWALDTATATAARLCEDEPPPAQSDAKQPLAAPGLRASHTFHCPPNIGSRHAAQVTSPSTERQRPGRHALTAFCTPAITRTQLGEAEVDRHRGLPAGADSSSRACPATASTSSAQRHGASGGALDRERFELIGDHAREAVGAGGLKAPRLRAQQCTLTAGLWQSVAPAPRRPCHVPSRPARAVRCGR